MRKLARLFLTFDMLGDLKRSGPLQWKIDRFRTEDVKDHVFDLILYTRLLKEYLPSDLDYEKMVDYAIVHDLEEVITGDITCFEGVSKEEKKRVNKIAMDYLIDTYGDINNLESLFNEFEEKTTLESKIMNMLDKVSSSVPFMKYDYEKKVDMDNPAIVQCLRENKGVVELRNQGLSLGEIFYIWHMRSVVITDEELEKYNITREEADKITNAIKGLMGAIHDEVVNTYKIKEEFPKEATVYRYIND